MNIPGYRMERELGHGGMSTVYLAEQESLGRKVALKIMAPALAADRSFGERFLKEGRTVAQLNHPNILAVYDIGSDGHHYYMVMEYVPGGDLKQRIRRGALAPEEALAILRQTAAALGYAHGKGFVHRDVKPENILFREDGTVVLSDFGIAKAVGSGTKMTGTGMSIGTPHYMSPEQAQGNADMDGRSDLYGLGIVLYEMLTGQVPFDAENTIGIAMQHVQGVLPQLPPYLNHFQPLFDRLLAKNPTERYADAGELIGAIGQVISGRAPDEVSGIAVAPQPQVTRVSASAETKKGSALRWALGGALLAVLVAGGFLLINGNRPKPALGGGGTALPFARTASSTAPVPSATPISMERETPDQEKIRAAESPGEEPVRESKADQIKPRTRFGTVIETMDSGGYTYSLVDTGADKFWAAAPQYQVQVGDHVDVPEGMPMSNYHSKSLNRTFEVVHFVNEVRVERGGVVDIRFDGLHRAEGGYTVAEIFAERTRLSGQDVDIRGKVVKFSSNIMGWNWIHLQDGTGESGNNDLTVTTDAEAKVGDTVLVNGTVIADKDFGYGYKYDVFIEDASVSVE